MENERDLTERRTNNAMLFTGLRGKGGGRQRFYRKGCCLTPLDPVETIFYAAPEFPNTETVIGVAMNDVPYEQRAGLRTGYIGRLPSLRA